MTAHFLWIPYFVFLFLPLPVSNFSPPSPPSLLLFFQSGMAQQQGAYGAYGGNGGNSGMGVEASPMRSSGRYMFYMHYTCAHTFTCVTCARIH